MSRQIDGRELSLPGPLGLYQTALAAPWQAMGYYNRNVRATDGGRQVLVRIPIPGADEMDLRVMPEADVLVAIAPYLEDVPRLLHSSPEPQFQVHEYVEGEVVNAGWPRGYRLPPRVIPAIVDLLLRLRHVPREALPAVAGWPADGDTASFGLALSNTTEAVYQRFRRRYWWALREFQVPDDPLRAVRERWLGMTSRPFCLLHCDIHRKNMILTPDRVVFLDWELALWGDPLYDLAVHVSKMGYLPDERDQVVDGWVRVMPAAATDGWCEDLATYLIHEQVKEALVGCIRYVRLFEEGRLTAAEQEQLAVKLTTKMAVAHVAWHGTDARSPTRDVVRAALRLAGERARKRGA
ncbi:MAG: aminoglycoside phosphotransferase family protein [Chloroflexi bacterium]|nr:MAG: aminoglycoside phosphotransferase family protein [Chloroflexota bacterium]